jgi:hypothetical protein
VGQGDAASIGYQTVDSPLDKRSSTSASLHVRSFPSPSTSVCGVGGRVRIALRMVCFFVDVSGDIMTLSYGVTIVHIVESGYTLNSASSLSSVVPSDSPA